MATIPSGKDKLLRHTRLYAGGYDLSGDARAFSSLDAPLEEIEMSGWSNPTQFWRSSGRANARLTGFTAFMNPDVGRAFDRLKDTPQAQQISVGFGGGGAPAAGDPAFLMAGVQLGSAISFDNNIVLINADMLFDSATFDAYAGNPLGVVLQGAVELSATGQAGSYDYGAAQSGVSGAQALLHVLVASGTTWTFKVEHSTDDAIWADLITFTADGSTITSERGTTTSTVNQYVRFNFVPGAAGTVTVVCTFSRLVVA